MGEERDHMGGGGGGGGEREMGGAGGRGGGGERERWVVQEGGGGGGEKEREMGGGGGSGVGRVQRYNVHVSTFINYCKFIDHKIQYKCDLLLLPILHITTKTNTCVVISRPLYSTCTCICALQLILNKSIFLQSVRTSNVPS